MTLKDSLFNHTARRPFSRRSFVQAGAWGIGGMTLADLMRLKADGSVRSSASDTSVILFWLSGGPGHMETWDPKPQAPMEYRGPFGAIETNVSGIQFGELMPEQARDAFDVSRESDSVRDQYGRHTFGQSALVARRLVEHGVSFVTVNCVPWDHHGSPGQYKTEEGARLLIPPLDCAIAALVDDLIARGMYQKTLIVAMGEFGRTPRMNANAGRDHWGNTFSVLFGGGGMNMGQAIGHSSARGEHVADRPIDPQDIAATIYHHLGINAQAVTFYDHLDRPLPLLDRGEPIRELIG